MKKQRTNPTTISTYNTIKKMRGNWGQINPVTKVIPNKKKNPKTKHKGKEYDYDN